MHTLTRRAALVSTYCTWASKPMGHSDLPERCANLCFGGAKRTGLPMAASHSLHAVHVNTQGAVGG